MKSVYQQLCIQTPYLPRSVERTFVNLPATIEIAIAITGVMEYTEKSLRLDE